MTFPACGVVIVTPFGGLSGFSPPPDTDVVDVVVPTARGSRYSTRS
jgi:hypothetical protein